MTIVRITLLLAAVILGLAIAGHRTLQAPAVPTLKRLPCKIIVNRSPSGMVTLTIIPASDAVYHTIYYDRQGNYVCEAQVDPAVREFLW